MPYGGTDWARGDAGEAAWREASRYSVLVSWQRLGQVALIIAAIVLAGLGGIGVALGLIQ
jgi:hypothetical protein